MAEATQDPFWLGAALLELGALAPGQLASAKQFWRRHPKGGFSNALETLGLATAAQLAGLVARRHALPLAELGPRGVDRSAARLIPLERARQRCVLAYRQEGLRVDLAVEDPAVYGQGQAREDLPGREVRLRVAPRPEILGLLEEAWRDEGPADAGGAFSQLVREAIAARASDIHLEPRDHALDVRLRIDGHLIHQRFIDEAARDPLIQAAKIAGGMDISERRRPQDGQGVVEVGGKRHHLRFSCIPAVNGESLVVRLIEDQAGLRTFAEMGLFPCDQERLRELLGSPNGLVYVTGPTGAGKTTLLHSMLHNLPPERINELKIVTLEEPVEIRHPRFLMQVGVDERAGRTFSELLRHVLRHDPDVILVGETRDRQTAEITLRAALTGRLCLSTLHTNDALGAVARLADIGLDPVMLASALRGVIAQRLVRRPCPECRRTHPQSDLLLRRFAGLLDGEAIPRDRRGFLTVCPKPSCPACGGRGYAGRTAIVEVYPLAGLERLVAERAPPRAFLEHLRPRGRRTLFEDGVLKAALGLTTIEEVYGALEEAV